MQHVEERNRTTAVIHRNFPELQGFWCSLLFVPLYLQQPQDMCYSLLIPTTNHPLTLSAWSALVFMGYGPDLMEVDLNEAVDNQEGGYWFDFEQLLVSKDSTAKSSRGVESEGDRSCTAPPHASLLPFTSTFHL